MSGSIFISYRRGADSNAAGRLHDRLEDHFSREQLFFDVDTIPPGVDFVDLLQEKVDACDVMLAVIGRGWLDARDEDGRARLDNPEDFVRIEVARGLSAKKHVIPVLVDGAAMPKAAMLPDDMKPLARRNAVQFKHETFKADCDRLARSLIETLAALEAARIAEREAREQAVREKRRMDDERKAREAAEIEKARIERDRAAAEESRRVKEEEARRLIARQHAAEQDARDRAEAEEADRKRLADDERARKGDEENAARETKAWGRARSVGTEASFRAYLDEWPDGPHAGEARGVIADIKEEAERQAPTRMTRRGALIAGGATVAVVAAASPLWFPAIFGRGRTVYATKVFTGHSGRILSGDIERRGWLAATGGEGGALHIWDLEALSEGPALRGHTDSVNSIAFAPRADEPVLLSASDDYAARLWSGPDFGKSLALDGHSLFVKGAAWSPDGSRIVTGGGRKVRQWTGRGALLRETSEEVGEGILRVAYSTDGESFAAAGDEFVKVWRNANANRIANLEGHTGTVNSITFSPEGNYLLSGSMDGTARVWRYTASQQVHLLRHDDWVVAARYSPNGRRIITASFDDTAKVWNASSGGLELTISGHWDSLGDACFSPGGHAIATTSGDHTARLWDAGTGDALAVFEGHEAFVDGIRFTPDGRRVLTWSEDRTVRLWDIPREILTG